MRQNVNLQNLQYLPQTLLDDHRREDIIIKELRKDVRFGQSFCLRFWYPSVKENVYE